MSIWQKILLAPDDALDHAIKILHKGGCRIALVVDQHNKLLGTITDGDIRRALIQSLSMNTPISLVMNNTPITANCGTTNAEILALMSDQDLLHVPIVDESGVLCGLETLQHLIEGVQHENPVFLMAGGFGTRLYPLTKDIPKPLLKVGEKPILDTIVEQFVDYGFHNFYISTHFKSEQIREYFKNEKFRHLNITFIHEEQPLGTAGSLGLLPSDTPDIPIIVMNGDLLTKVNFKDLLDFHNNHDSEATMCVRGYDFQLPYGVIEIEDYKVKGIEEKPTHNFFVNAGIYVLNKSLIDKIDGKTYLDMTDLLQESTIKGSVGAFPVHEYWLDIGQIDEYERANQEVSAIFS